ncbi:MAG: hypothetical protein LUD25_00625 [Coriobacteriaceae bacterium]|nr:hypothetical protein [Coriobacteriaceae bacterium]
MRKQIAVLFATLLVAGMCCFALAGCGEDDAASIKGEWQVQDTTVTVVFTDTEFKTVASTFEYSIDTQDKTITYTQGEMEGQATYEFDDDNKQMTLTESDGDGGTQVTTFVKVSDDTSAEPTVEYGTPEADSEEATDGTDELADE